MPQYTLINPDGSRELVKYRMKDSLTMRRIRLEQMSRKLARLSEDGRIPPNERKHRLCKLRREIDAKFAPALIRGTS